MEASGTVRYRGCGLTNARHSVQVPSGDLAVMHELAQYKFQLCTDLGVVREHVNLKFGWDAVSPSCRFGVVREHVNLTFRVGAIFPSYSYTAICRGLLGCPISWVVAQRAGVHGAGGGSSLFFFLLCALFEGVISYDFDVCERRELAGAWCEEEEQPVVSSHVSQFLCSTQELSSMLWCGSRGRRKEGSCDACHTSTGCAHCSRGYFVFW